MNMLSNGSVVETPFEAEPDLATYFLDKPTAFCINDKGQPKTFLAFKFNEKSHVNIKGLLPAIVEEGDVVAMEESGLVKVFKGDSDAVKHMQPAGSCGGGQSTLTKDAITLVQAISLKFSVS